MEEENLYEKYKKMLKDFPKEESTYIRGYFHDLREETDIAKKNKLKMYLYYLCLNKAFDLIDISGLITDDIARNDIKMKQVLNNYLDMLNKHILGYVSYEDFYHFMGRYLFNGIESYKIK